MFLLVKKIDGEDVIIGTAQKKISLDDNSDDDITIFEIPDVEYKPDMIHSKLDSYEEY